MNIYDFDKTIYDGDSTLDFYKFSLKKNKKIIFYLPKQILFFILYKVKLKTKIEFKECFFSFLKEINNLDKDVEQFWKENIDKIKNWYLKQKDKTDIIISASPEFLLKPLEKKLNITIIASKVNSKTGKFESKNCYGEEKVKRLKELHPKINVKNFYTDHISDLPMLKISKNGYIVKKDKINKYIK